MLCLICRDAQPGSQRRRRKPPGPPPGTPPVLSDSDDEEYDPEKGVASFPCALCNFLKCYCGVCGLKEGVVYLALR